ncbi:facilitated trehalose transporter Tret1-like [Onthophagus taurus]|uniref:facilitated trehalose transporter Tret1-like n=1 Tax=Onthophagus taurus TaxID=166361 RepID=UPI000C1FEE3D|nr:facilitated trehalose transporter Tret1-like [Onthophagus taurus]
MVEVICEKIDEKKSSKDVSKAKDFPQVRAMMTAAIAMVSAGTLFTWPSPSVPKLQEAPYNFTIEELSYLTVIPPIAMVIFSPIYCWLLDNFSRKYTLFSSGFFHIASWILIYFADDIWIFYGSRFVCGIADACCFASMPAYIAEVATPRIRGLYGNAMMVLMFIGQFLINCIGYYTSIKTTALCMMVFPITFLFLFASMPESPYFCIMKGREEDARKSLQRLRGIENVDVEYEQIFKDVSRQMTETTRYVDLWSIKSNRKAVIIANLARAFQQFSGISALMVYSQYIFNLSGGNISGGHAAMLFNGILAFINLFANVISDGLGRKKSMIFSCIGCGLGLLGESIYFYFNEYTNVDTEVASWFPVVGLIIYIIIFTFGLGIVPTLLLGELFNTSIRGKAALVTNCLFAIQLCGISKLFQILMTGFGLTVPFFFFTVCCFLGGIASYFVIPETKGKTLEQIQQMLK